ncbi:MAG: hypothetical protein ACRCXM_02990 [Beijerinckiaceae bacterium]
MTKFALTAAAFLALIGTPALAENINGELSSRDRAEVTRVQQKADAAVTGSIRADRAAYAYAVSGEERVRESGQSN